MTERIGGGVLRRKPKPHECNPPDIAAHKIETGDEWECVFCTGEWVVEFAHDPRPGEGGPYWKRKTTPLGSVGVKGEWIGSTPPKGGDWDGDCG